MAKVTPNTTFSEVNCVFLNMSLVVSKPVFGISDQVPHKSGCIGTEDGWRLEILGRREIVLSVTAKLICVFVFAYAKSRFSHAAAHMQPAD